METLASLIDTLITLNLKLWFAVEEEYRVARGEVTLSAEEARDLIRKVVSLNQQRSRCIDTLDERIVQALQQRDLSNLVCPKHKSPL